MVTMYLLVTFQGQWQLLSIVIGQQRRAQTASSLMRSPQNPGCGDTGEGCSTGLKRVCKDRTKRFRRHRTSVGRIEGRFDLDCEKHLQIL